MAGIKIMKYSKQNIYGAINHVYRVYEHHKNKDIDPEKSKENENIWDAKTCRENIKAAVKTIDEKIPPKRVKKDRKILLELDVWAPREDTSKEKAVEFLKAFANQLYKDGYIIVGGSIHVDEMHEYYDAKQKRIVTSRPHLHLLVVPYSKEHGINMKEFTTKDFLKEMNRIANELSREICGVEYNNGSYEHSEKSVEELKVESSRELERHIEQQKEEIERKNAEITEKQDELDCTEQTLEIQSEALTDVLFETDKAKKKKDEIDASIKESEEKKQEIIDSANHDAEEIIKSAEQSAKEIERDTKQKQQSYVEKVNDIVNNHLYGAIDQDESLHNFLGFEALTEALMEYKLEDGENAKTAWDLFEPLAEEKYYDNRWATETLSRSYSSEEREDEADIDEDRDDIDHDI